MTTETTFTKEIKYAGRKDGYSYSLDGELVGYARTYHEAEVTLDNLVYEQLQHTPAPTDEQLIDANPELAYSAADCDAPVEVAEEPTQDAKTPVTLRDVHAQHCAQVARAANEDPFGDPRTEEEKRWSTEGWASVHGGWEKFGPHPFDPTKTVRHFRPRLGGACDCPDCISKVAPQPVDEDATIEESEILDHIMHDGVSAALSADPDEDYPGQEDGCPPDCPDGCPDHGHGSRDLIQTIAAELADAEEAAGNRAGLNAVNKAAFHLASGVEYRWALGDLLIGSGTRAGTVHRVRLSGGGTWICSCEAAANGRDCWHCCAAEILATVRDWGQRQAA